MIGTLEDALTVVVLLCFGLDLTVILAPAFMLFNKLVLYQITSMRKRIPSTA